MFFFKLVSAPQQTLNLKLRSDLGATQ